MSTPPPNKYFHTAVFNPDPRISSTNSQAHGDPLPYENPFKFGAALSQAHIMDTIKVIVGADPTTQRTWYLPKALLIRHSTNLAQLCANPVRSVIRLEDVDVRAFANFVDYMRSSIYTLNEQIFGFRRIHEGTKACLLGRKLGATAYSNAALNNLHMLFEPLARLKSSNMLMSTIRAEDVDFVCRNTDANSDKLGRGLRQLFLDAVASHWSNWEAKKLPVHHDKDMVEWTDLCTKYADFRITMLTSCSKPDARRKELLKAVHEYMDAEKPAVKEEGTVDELGKTTPPLIVIGGRGIVSPRGLLLSLKRRGSSERRRRERAEAGQVDTGAGQDGNGNKNHGEVGGNVQTAAEQDWTLVDAEIKRKE